MKINEITKFNKDLSAGLKGRHNPKIHKFLTDKGWKYVDQGFFSVVYISPNNKTILKVNRIPDPGYDHFVDVIKANKNNHFPVISDKKTLPDGSSAYLIERLYDMTYDADRKIMMAVLDANSYMMVNKFDDYVKLYPTLVEKLKKEQPGMIEALMILAKNKGQYTDDLRHDNIMKRADGTVIIIDPYGVTK
jgi:hypothetical protein